MHTGILFPQTTASGTSGDHKGLGLFIEEWDYGVKDEQEGRGVWRDGDNGGFCEEAFNVTTLQKVDVSIGAFPAYAYIMQGSERFLDAIYGNWRSKLDKQAYKPGQGKPGDWAGADVVKVCQEVHRSNLSGSNRGRAAATGDPVVVSSTTTIQKSPAPLSLHDYLGHDGRTNPY